MAGSFCDYWEDAALNHILGKSAYTAPAALYLGLSSTSITDAGGNITEPSSGGYARVQVDPGDWAAVSDPDREIAISAAKSFPVATGSWGSALTDWFLSDAGTGGNICVAGTLTDGPLTVGTDDQYQIPASDLVIGFNAGVISNYLARVLLNHVFGKSGWSAPSNIYVALSTADPDADASGLAEPADEAYARYSTAAANWATVSGGISSNSAKWSYDEATEEWGTIAYVALLDALTDGNELFYGALTNSKSVVTGNIFDWPAGNLQVSMS